MPLALVLDVVVTVPLRKEPLAPLPGALKVTGALATGLPYWSITEAPNGVANEVPTVAV